MTRLTSITITIRNTTTGEGHHWNHWFKHVFIRKYLQIQG